MAGDVVRIADPAALAGKAIGLLGSPDAWHAAQQAGIRRVERYYTQEMMVGSYRDLYTRLMAQPRAQAPSGMSPASSAQAAGCPMKGGR